MERRKHFKNDIRELETLFHCLRSSLICSVTFLFWQCRCTVMFRISCVEQTLHMQQDEHIQSPQTVHYPATPSRTSVDAVLCKQPNLQGPYSQVYLVLAG